MVVASVNKVKLFRRDEVRSFGGNTRWMYLVVWDGLSLPFWTFLTTHGKIVGYKVGLLAADGEGLACEVGPAKDRPKEGARHGCSS